MIYDLIMNTPDEGGYYCIRALAKQKLGYAYFSSDAQAARMLRDAGYKVAAGFAPHKNGFCLIYNVYK